MKRTLCFFICLCMFVMTADTFAQSQRRGTGNMRQQDPNAVNLLNKEKSCTFLGLTDEQKKVIGPEIDELSKIMEPVIAERQNMMKKMRSGQVDRSQMRDMRQKMMTKYESTEKEIQKRLGKIEKMLTKEQKEKFKNVVKPTTTMRRRNR